MIFPERNVITMSYVYMENTYTGTYFESLATAFWIKIPSGAAEDFTLISYSVPSQVKEFNVKFTDTGIAMHLHGKRRYISNTVEPPFERTDLDQRLLSVVQSRAGLTPWEAWGPPW